MDTVWSHILSTGGDALRVPPNTVIKISEFSTSEATWLLGLHRSCFWGGSIDVCKFPYLGISLHVLGFMGGEKVARSKSF
jgi:hypothetical protein